ncbi:DUF488 domain-containing protein [Thalassoglobus polymorphus]|uniref:Uroporphyrin-III C-methyltransferase n=1 Tax=Thalassoglobus polymorphus TaxID=2527994 RepID=A0A517QQF2_9PLAN|nr:DUF488 family protein [Thalassoglobus polymorphus]QDT33862.1 hypothetical protein Mal48_31180 [Thalassoglobus polymorphus]
MANKKAKKKPTIRTIRAYDIEDSDEGYRVLVDRLWPRGVKKETLQLDEWAKDLAPSSELRKWFGHDPEKWEVFQERYKDELKELKEARRELLDNAGDQTILMIYAAKDGEHNHTVVLEDFLKQG